MFKSVGFVVLSGVFAVACAGSEGSSGAQGSSAMITAAPEAAGKNCPNGGQAMTYGVDSDGDGKLDESEVDGTSFLCNGAAGANGANGAQGAEGAQGAQGAAGLDGQAAAKGEKGDPGAQGQQGLQGIQGNQGLQGATGNDGKDGVDGVNGTDGKDGVDGTDGVDGKDGVNGKDAPVAILGQFLASQLSAGMVVECASTNLSAGLAECRGMKVNGLDLYLGPKEANAICMGITGKGYDSASGLGVVPAPWLSVKADGSWQVAAAGNASPMQNLTCKR
jgi:hypothetical protein